MGLAGGVFLGPGCVSRPEDPLQLTIDRTADPARRLDAFERVDHGDPRAVAALYNLVFSDAEPHDLRASAMRRLAVDRPRWVAEFNGRVVEVEQWPILRELLRQASTMGPEAAAGIVRSWSRASRVYDDRERPERAALEAASGGRDADEVLVEVFMGRSPGVEVALREQVAAWTVLSRVHPPATLRRLLASAPAAAGLVADLRAAAGVLDVLPADREGVLWLASLRDRDGGGWWLAAAERAQRLSPEQRRGLELRHLAALGWAPEDRLRLSEASLAAAIRARIGDGPHAARTDYGVIGGPDSETFADHADALHWPDLLAIDLLLDAMESRPVVQQWFEQADADHADTGTEHGGVLHHDAGRGWLATAYSPLLRVHDSAFYASPELFEAMYAGLAHYHFHAQRHRGARFAGPGGGDLRFADRLRPTGVVLTFLDRDTLNVDYYAAGRVVVDLGVVRR